MDDEAIAGYLRAVCATLSLPALTSSALPSTIASTGSGKRKGRPSVCNDARNKRRRAWYAEQKLCVKPLGELIVEGKLQDVLQSHTLLRHVNPLASNTRVSKIAANADRLIANAKPKHREFLRTYLYEQVDVTSAVVLTPRVS